MSRQQDHAAQEGTGTQVKSHLDAALSLHAYLRSQHWDGHALRGPDPGIRINARLGRFVKSYTPFLPWSDDMVYMQAQGYWIMANSALARRTGDRSSYDISAACAAFVRDSQVGGRWEYPNREWRSRVATVEGCFAGLGLLEAHESAPVVGALAAAQAWERYVEEEVGFRDQQGSTEMAVNYFASDTGRVGGVPNNATLLLWFLARLWKATGSDRHLVRTEPLIRWLARVQRASGELPYALGSSRANDRPHFLCYQYNAFEFLDLVHYWRITGDDSVAAILEPLASFLSDGLDDRGRPRFGCGASSPRVLYYGVAIARALSEATRLGMGDHAERSRAGFRWALQHQRSDGSFRFHSSKNYGMLQDTRAYPRYLSMVLLHLIQESDPTGGGSAREP